MKYSEVKEGRLPVFKERFGELRNGRSNTEFADYLGMSRQTVGFYLNGDRIPDALVLKDIAEKCGVSADWLLGLSDYQSTNANEQTAQSLGLPESLVRFLMFVRRIASDKEFDFIRSVFDSSQFKDAIKCVARISNIQMPNEAHPDGLKGCELIHLADKLDKDVLSQTGGQYSVGQVGSILSGEIFAAQLCFTNAIYSAFGFKNADLSLFGEEPEASSNVQGSAQN